MDSLADYFAPDSLLELSPQKHENCVSELRREIFDLKLQLHLTRNSCTNFKKEECDFSDFSTLRNENLQLRKEVESHVELLKTASLAIDDHERAQKNYVITHQAKIAEQENEIRRLEENNAEEKLKIYMDIKSSIKYKELEGKLQQQAKEIKYLESELANRDREIQMSSKKLEKLTFKNDGLVDKIVKYEEFSVVAKQILDYNVGKLADAMVDIDRLTQLYNKNNNAVSSSKLMNAYRSMLRNFKETREPVVKSSKSDSFIVTAEASSNKKLLKIASPPERSRFTRKKNIADSI